MIIALCTFLAVLAVPLLGLDSDSTLISPCPNVFKYELPSTEPFKWYGVINLTTDYTLHSLWLNILFDDKADILENWIGDVSTQDNKNFQIENANMQINPGDTVTMRMSVNYRNKPPRLRAIRLNGREICTAANTRSSIPWVKHDTEPDGNLTESPRPVYVKSRNSFINIGTPLDRTIDAAIRILKSPKSTNSRGIDGQPLCGKVVSNPKKQNGKTTLEIQWPWQIAMYQTENVRNRYICGGTLVTARHVITAAHCITMRSSNSVVDRHTLAVFLGKQNLWTSDDAVQVRFVKEIIVHPLYNVSTYSRNVAILELHKPLKYTDRIRPACLWPDNEIETYNVIGKKGLLLSWGFDDKDKVIHDLSQEEMPVVSQATCIRSHKRFVHFTSEHTYCAGNRDDTSSCASGGSGMVFKIGSTWHLRGLTSLATPGHGRKRCDTSYYVIFTDLATISPWIYSIVFDF